VTPDGTRRTALVTPDGSRRTALVTPDGSRRTEFGSRYEHAMLASVSLLMKTL